MALKPGTIKALFGKLAVNADDFVKYGDDAADAAKFYIANSVGDVADYSGDISNIVYKGRQVAPHMSDVTEDTTRLLNYYNNVTDPNIKARFDKALNPNYGVLAKANNYVNFGVDDLRGLPPGTDAYTPHWRAERKAYTKFNDGEPTTLHKLFNSHGGIKYPGEYDSGFRKANLDNMPSIDHTLENANTGDWLDDITFDEDWTDSLPKQSDRFVDVGDLGKGSAYEGGAIVTPDDPLWKYGTDLDPKSKLQEQFDKLIDSRLSNYGLDYYGDSLMPEYYAKSYYDYAMKNDLEVPRKLSMAAEGLSEQDVREYDSIINALAYAEDYKPGIYEYHSPWKRRGGGWKF